MNRTLGRMLGFVILAVLATGVTYAGKWMPIPLHVLIQDSDLIVVATAAVRPPKPPGEAPQRAAAGAPAFESEKARLKIERVVKGPNKDLKEATLLFDRAVRPGGGGFVPQDGQRAVWLLEAGQVAGEYSCVRIDRVREAQDEEIARVERMVAVLRATAGGSPPTEAEIRGMVAGPDEQLAALGIDLMGATEPARYADVLKEKLSAGGLYRGAQDALEKTVLALPPDVAVPLLMEVIGEQRGNYLQHDAARAPLGILAAFVKQHELAKPLEAAVRRGLIARYERDGSIFHEQLQSRGDPLVAVLADVTDDASAEEIDAVRDLFQQALVSYPLQAHVLAEVQRMPGGLEQIRRGGGTVDPGAVAGLWQVQGPAALPLFRDHVRESESAIQKILGEHGDMTDFPLLLGCVTAEHPRAAFAAQDAMKRLIARAGLKTEPWMDVREQNQQGVVGADRWQAWWEAHRELP